VKYVQPNKSLPKFTRPTKFNSVIHRA